MISKSILKNVYKKRELWSHKGQYGKLVVIAGCKKHTGSACFVGLAAYKSGCDLVYIASPKRSADIAANFSPILITEPLEGDKLTMDHVEKIISLIKEVRGTAVVIGQFAQGVIVSHPRLELGGELVLHHGIYGFTEAFLSGPSQTVSDP